MPNFETNNFLIWNLVSELCKADLCSMHKILVLLASLSSEGSGESVHMGMDVEESLDQNLDL